MKIASIAEVKTHLSAFVDEAVASGPVVITRNGKAVAVLIAPMDEDDLESILIYRSPRMQALLENSRKSIAEGRGIPHDELWRKVRERYQTPLAVGEKRGEYNTKKPRKRAKKETAT